MLNQNQITKGDWRQRRRSLWWSFTFAFSFGFVLSRSPEAGTRPAVAVEVVDRVLERNSVMLEKGDKRVTLLLNLHVALIKDGLARIGNYKDFHLREHEGFA